MASGCLGLISFPREPGRVTLERIEELYPTLISALRDHPGIGFMLVRSERHGAIVDRRAGHALPRRGSGRRGGPAWRPSARTPPGTSSAPMAFPHCADIMVNSTYWPETDEVAAFEELVGSHGGMGGPQSYPFVLVPAGLGASRRSHRRC